MATRAPWYSSTVILDRQSLWSSEILRILAIFFHSGWGERGYGLVCMPVYFLEEIPGKGWLSQVISIDQLFGGYCQIILQKE